jgi:hypothetical protein
MMLTSQQLLFIRPSSSFSSTKQLTIPLSDILEVNFLMLFPLHFDDADMYYGTIKILTYAKEYNVIIKKKHIYNQW